MNIIQLQNTGFDPSTPMDPYHQLLQMESEIEALRSSVTALQAKLTSLNDPNNPDGVPQLYIRFTTLIELQYQEKQKGFVDPSLDAEVNVITDLYETATEETRTDIPNAIAAAQKSLQTVITNINNLLNNLAYDSNNPLELGALEMLARRMIADANDPTDPSNPNFNTQLLKQTSQNIQDYANVSNDLENRMLYLMGDITSSEIALKSWEDTLSADENKLKLDIAALACASASIFGLLDPEFVDNVQDDEAAIANDKSHITNLEAEIANDRAELKTDMQTLAAIDIIQLAGMIGGLVEQVKKMLKILSGPNGNSEANMREAAGLLVAVLNTLQAITSKVHELNQQDQQFMSLASADNFQIAEGKSQSDLVALANAEAFASSIKILLDVAEGLMTTLSVIAAVGSGGAGAILVALVMATFNVISMATEGKIDITQKALDQLEDLLAKTKMGDSAGTKVLADAIAAVIIMIFIIVTDGAAGGSAAGAEGSAAAQSAEQSAKEEGIELTNLLKSAVSNAAEEIPETESTQATQAFNSAVNRVVQSVEEDGEAETTQIANSTTSLINGVEEATTEEASGATPALSQTGEAATANETKGIWNTIKEIWSAITNCKPLMYTVMYFMMFNGFSDSFEAIAEKIKSKNELNDDEAFQILKIIAQILQAIMMMYAANKAYSANGNSAQSSLLQNLLKNLNVEFNPATIAQFTMVIQMAGNSLNLLGNLGMADVNYMKSQIDPDLGRNTATQLVYQNILNMIKNAQDQDDKKAAAQIQQLGASIQETVQKMAEAENEAARLLTENAV